MKFSNANNNLLKPFQCSLLPIGFISRIVVVLPFIATPLAEALPTATPNDQGQEYCHHPGSNSNADNGILGQFGLPCQVYGVGTTRGVGGSGSGTRDGIACGDLRNRVFC